MVRASRHELRASSNSNGMKLSDTYLKERHEINEQKSTYGLMPIRSCAPSGSYLISVPKTLDSYSRAAALHRRLDAGFAYGQSFVDS